MRIISKKTLKDFYGQLKYQDSKSALEFWQKEIMGSSIGNKALYLFWCYIFTFWTGMLFKKHKKR